MARLHAFGILILFASSCSHSSSDGTSQNHEMEAGMSESNETLQAYVNVKVISNLKKTQGGSPIDKDGYAKVEGVRAVESVIDFSETSLNKIVEAACDRKVSDLKVQSKSDAKAVMDWNFLSSPGMMDGAVKKIPGYSASLRHLEGSLYSLTCVAKNY